jgi:hypothetical protein
MDTTSHKTREQCPECGKEWLCLWHIKIGDIPPRDGTASRQGVTCYACTDARTLELNGRES